MIKYLLGLLKFLFHKGVSLQARVDNSSSVSMSAKVYGKTKMLHSSLGEYSYLTRGSSLVFAKVGKYCSIGHGSSIGMGEHQLKMLSTSPIFTETRNATGHSWTNISMVTPYRRVTIGNDVWIGTRVMVMGGISIGDGAVVAAGAIVTKDVPPYAVVAGVPAKVVKFRFEPQIISKLLEVQWWNMDTSILKSKIHLFQKEDLTLEDIEKISQ